MDALHALKAIAAQARDAERAHAGRLVALLVGVPAGVDADDAERSLRAALAPNHGRDVEVNVEPRQGPIRILRMEFAR